MFAASLGAACGAHGFIAMLWHMDKKTAEKILAQTESGYDLIAKKFAQTRKHFWREFDFIKEYVKPDDKVLDFGCGSGRLAAFLSETGGIDYVGADVSQALGDIARDNFKCEFVKLDPQSGKLPWAEGEFDAIFSIAVFHHFPSHAYRAQMARELRRIVKKDGYVIVTVWNLWQPRYFQNIFKNWRAKLWGKSQLDWNDCQISFTDNQGRKFERFHHAFGKRELRKLFSRAGFRVEKCEIVKGRNMVLVAKKEEDEV